uniref:Uncharacterized protein n=1 Tax=Rhizophora mucronata TaxID=61149 RepID=A0A2P2K121_RHIMU
MHFLCFLVLLFQLFEKLPKEKNRCHGKIMCKE